MEEKIDNLSEVLFGLQEIIKQGMKADNQDAKQKEMQKDKSSKSKKGNSGVEFTNSETTITRMLLKRFVFLMRS